MPWYQHRWQICSTMLLCIHARTSCISTYMWCVDPKLSSPSPRAPIESTWSTTIIRMKYSSGYYLDVAKSSMSKAGVGELTLSCLKCILGPTSFQGIPIHRQCTMYIIMLYYIYEIVDENIPNITWAASFWSLLQVAVLRENSHAESESSAPLATFGQRKD